MSKSKSAKCFLKNTTLHKSWNYIHKFSLLIMQKNLTTALKMERLYMTIYVLFLCIDNAFLKSHSSLLLD